MTTFILLMAILSIAAGLGYISTRVKHNHEIYKAMLREISNQVVDESSEVKKKINMLFDYVDEIRQDLKKEKPVRETVAPKKEKSESGTYIRSEETRKKLSDKRKAYWDAKKAEKLKESAPGTETTSLSQAFE